MRTFGIYGSNAKIPVEAYVADHMVDIMAQNAATFNVYGNPDNAACRILISSY